MTLIENRAFISIRSLLVLFFYFFNIHTYAQEFKIHGTPMPPQLRSSLGTAWQIYIEGPIPSNAGEQLRTFLRTNDVPGKSFVYLNSPGGSLVGGLQLGRVLRENQMFLNIGQKTPYQTSNIFDVPPGNCFSACALAYLGGRFRFLSSNSKLGFHQFFIRKTISQNSAISTAQVLSAEIVLYLQEMAIDVTFFREIVRAGPDTLLIPSSSSLKKYNIVNNGVEPTIWKIDSASSLYLVGSRNTIYGMQKLLISCNRRQASIMAIFDPRQPKTVLDRLTFFRLQIENQHYPYSQRKILFLNGSATLVHILRPEEILNLWNSTKLGMKISSSAESNKYLGVNSMPLYQDGLRKMRGILKDCKPNGGNNQPSDVTRQEFQDRNEQPRWCNRASTAQELLICRNPNLSYLDINFNRIFIAAWRDNKSLARSLSRQFRRQRKQCALDERCISDVYRYFSRELRVSRYQ